MWERLCKREQPAIFHFIAEFPPPRVIAVLLPAASVPAGRLNVTERVRTDPDVAPRGRDRERLDTLENLLARDGMAAGIEISVTASDAFDATVEVSST
jgi:hypothetical protein